MADKVYGWNPFTTWTASATSATLTLPGGTTWTPFVDSPNTGSDSISVFTLKPECLVQTYTHNGITYTATFRGYVLKYTGTYPEEYWSPRVTVSGPTVTIDHHTEFRTEKPSYSAGRVIFEAQWTLGDSSPDTGVPIYGKIGTLLHGADGALLYRG